MYEDIITCCTCVCSTAGTYDISTGPSGTST